MSEIKFDSTYTVYQCYIFYNRDKRIFDSIPLLKLIILQLYSHIKE